MLTLDRYLRPGDSDAIREALLVQREAPALEVGLPDPGPRRQAAQLAQLQAQLVQLQRQVDEMDFEDSGEDALRRMKRLMLPPAASSGGNDHSWRFVPTAPTGATGGTVTLGQVFIGAGPAKTVTSFPGGGTLSGVTSTTYYWVAVDRSAATATWGSGASVPENTDTVEYYPVLTLTCSAGVITGIVQRYTSDIHETLLS